MLYVGAEDIPEQVVQMRGGGELRTSQVVGQGSSLTVASRSPGYHSEPHTHDCEQLNYLRTGQLWVFVEVADDAGKPVVRAWHLEPGSFLRIPPGAVHWAWNHDGMPCVLIESHAPGLLLDGVTAPRLLGDNELAADLVPSRWVDRGPYWGQEAAAMAAVEAGREAG